MLKATYEAQRHQRVQPVGTLFALFSFRTRSVELNFSKIIDI